MLGNASVLKRYSFTLTESPSSCASSGLPALTFGIKPSVEVDGIIVISNHSGRIPVRVPLLKSISNSASCQSLHSHFRYSNATEQPCVCPGVAAFDFGPATRLQKLLPLCRLKDNLEDCVLVGCD